MNPAEFQDKVDHVSRLLAKRLGAKGASLGERINHRARALPRRVRVAARELARLEPMMGAPKLMKQVDQKKTDRNYRICIKYLEPLGAEQRLVQGVLKVITGIVFLIVLTGGAMLAYAIAHGQL
ncbi:hypothetical protein [Thioclava sp. GXIMD2076]|uniref:Uncharacterized protein n=1 Tax=Thioclava kandeliae TaxID=3070818 RepID=A0ABV1SFP4_9RHOB